MDRYLLFWIITAILGKFGIKLSDGKNKNVLILSNGLLPCIFLFVIAGIRSLSVGSDNIAYAYYFLRMTIEKIHLFSRGEYWVYNLWVYIIRSITDNMIIFNIVCAAVVYFSLYIFIHSFSEDERLSVLLFFSLGYFFTAMNQTRQAMAIAILLLGFCFLMRKKAIEALLLCFIASFVHNVAIVMIPVYIFFAIVPVVSRKVVWIFSSVFVGIALTYEKFVSAFVYLFPRYKVYLRVAKLFQQKRSIYRYGDVLLALVLQIALIYVVVKSDKEKHHDNLACVLACMNAINLCMAYLVTNAEIFVRVKGIFGYWMIISIPYIITKYFSDNKLLKGVVALVSLLYLFRLGVKDGDGVIPYLFCWETS